MLKFGKDWGFRAGLLKKKESEGNFAKDRLKNAILKGGYASEEVLKASGKLKCNLENIRGYNAIFPGNGVLGSLGMQVEGLHVICKHGRLKCNFKGKTGSLNDFIMMQRTYV